jgi:hypothetical protein
MPTSFVLATILTICLGCGGGGYKIISGGKLQINSEPSGAEIEVFELKANEGSLWDQNSLGSSTYRGSTPMEISLDLQDANKRGIAAYLIKYNKKGYLPEIKLVQLSIRNSVDRSQQKAGKALVPLSMISPVIGIAGAVMQHNAGYTALSIPTEPIYAVMEPDNSAINIASSEMMNCLEKYLRNAEPKMENQEKPTFIKFIPVGWAIRWKGEPRGINCQRLIKEMEQGKKISFASGSLRFRDSTYIFSEDSCIELNEKNEIKCFGVNVERF